MPEWLASMSSALQAEEAEPLSIPPMWLRDRPHLRCLFDVKGGSLWSLYEVFCRQEDGTFCHAMNAKFLPSTTLPISQSMLDGLLVQIKSFACDLLSDQANLEHASDEETSEWGSLDGSYRVRVGAFEPEYLPSIHVIEFANLEPDFASLVLNSPLRELASLSPCVCVFDWVSCGRTCTSSPLVSIQAHPINSDIFSRLTGLGFQEREKVWWKDQIAIQSLSGGSWGAITPAPSFIAGAKK
jgi:hypothetical protein